ncbi:hypothetical protein BGZ82_008660 [Podila clonocystis]|nr:hypothetical protein BGZ82_008660 [Podila clonocystis]
MTSQVLILELNYRIGVFIPCWIRDQEEQAYDFCPKELVAASKVSRLCQSIQYKRLAFARSTSLRRRFRHLLTTNPGLVELTLCPGASTNYEDIHPPLESTSQFTVIHLHEFILTSGDQLKQALRSHGPKLTSIVCMEDEGIDDPEDDVVSFIELPSRLVKFSASPPIFTDKIYQALLYD